jgi:Bacterial DNA polymerase III alpha subunit finger domain
LERTLGVPIFQEQLLRIAMTVANSSGAEAEELRRAVGMRRSWERMNNLEGKLRDAMTANGLDAATQETIVQNISSFAFMASRITCRQLRFHRIRLSLLQGKVSGGVYPHQCVAGGEA